MIHVSVDEEVITVISDNRYSVLEPFSDPLNMYILVPTSNVGSPEKRDRFLGLLSDVAETTSANEPLNLAYAWFRSAEDNDVVPYYWVQGLEVYTELEASTVVHRSSDQYKAFRQAVANESLLDRGSDLRYLEELDIGFLAREPTPVDSEGYVVIERLKAEGGNDGRNRLLDQLRRLESEGLGDLDNSTVASFWALGYRPEDDDPTVVLFQRFASKPAFQDEFLGTESVQAIRQNIYSLCESTQVTTWVDAGIGFIGR